MGQGPLTKTLGAAFAGLVLTVVACSSAATVTSESSADSTPTETPPSTATAAASPASPSAVTPTPGTAVDSDPMGEDLFVLGERIFLTDAAPGVGCSACHGLDGRGSVSSGAPTIRGKFAWEIQLALDNNPVMEFLSLTPEEVEAVSEYLQWLETQP